MQTRGGRMSNLYGYLVIFTHFEWVGYSTHSKIERIIPYTHIKVVVNVGILPMF